MAKIRSTFTDGMEGWTFTGDPWLVHWFFEGGTPGAYLGWQDMEVEDTLVYYVAPEKFHGDLSAFYKGKLAYDIYDTYAANLVGYPDVKIVGGNGATLVAAVGQAGQAWTHESIGLKAGAGWHLDSLDGPLATTKDIKSVLADVVDLQIRAEYHDGGESGGIDSVVLRSKQLAQLAPDAFGADHHGHHDVLLALVGHPGAIVESLALA